jgi:outer membrane lipoprotein-sorting protein
MVTAKKGRLIVKKLAILLILIPTLLLSGCGTNKANPKSFGDALHNHVDAMNSYQAKGVLRFYTGDTPIDYAVEIDYKKPTYYRVAMRNDAEKVNQVILKNKSGVFIITPSQKQSFRFQTNWPKNQGQLYLYQSITQFIFRQLDAKQPLQKAAHNQYLITGKTDYPNTTMDQQKVWIHRQTYAPKKVELYDNQQKLRVAMRFQSFRAHVKFDRDYFSKTRTSDVYQIDRSIR